MVEQRNKAEIDRIVPVAGFSEDAVILDIGCGIGRWADAIKSQRCNIVEYYGIDFSEDMIRIANQRNDDPKYHFEVGKIKCPHSELTPYMEPSIMRLRGLCNNVKMG